MEPLEGTGTEYRHTSVDCQTGRLRFEFDFEIALKPSYIASDRCTECGNRFMGIMEEWAAAQADSSDSVLAQKQLQEWMLLAEMSHVIFYAGAAAQAVGEAAGAGREVITVRRGRIRAYRKKNDLPSTAYECTGSRMTSPATDIIGMRSDTPHKEGS